MTTAARSQFLHLLRDGETRLRADFQTFSDRARTYLMTAVDDATGKIPLIDQKKVEQQIAGAILYYFLASGATAYTLTSNGTLIPTSPYLRLLWRQVEEATRTAANAAAADERQALSGHDDLIKKLANAQLDPFSPAAFALLGDVDGLFRDYVAPYGLVWADGKTLQDRVLLCAAETRRKVALLLSLLLSEGKSAKEIAATLDQFMTGKLKGANKPYGTTAFYDASRLLLSETNYAHQKAALISGALDPFVDMVDIVLSPSHKEVDLCDEAAAGSPYAIKDAPVLGLHSGCLCQYLFHRNGRTVATAERLRGNPERLNVRGALSPGFAELLLRGGQ